MTTDTTTLTPVEVDTELARIWSDIDRQRDIITRIKLDLGRKITFGVKSGQPMFEGKVREGLETSLVKARSTLQDLKGDALPYEVEYSRRPWHRYFLVKNGNGHVHRDMNCTTCFPTTQYAWLVDLAACDESLMVEEWGERACTVCFPDAPVNPLYHRPARIDREAQAAREAEKAAKQAAKDEKAITDVDGSPLKVDGNILRTKVAARNELSQQFQYLVFYGGSNHQDNVRKLVPALAAAGVDWVPVAERAIKKATKEAHIDPSNPFNLSPEQITAAVNEIIANTAAAQALLREVRAV